MAENYRAETLDLESTLKSMETDLGRAQAVAQLAVGGMLISEERYQISLAALEAGKQYHSTATLYLASLSHDKNKLELFRKEIDDWDKQDKEVEKKLKDILPGLALETRAYVIFLAQLQGSTGKRIGPETGLSTEEQYKPEDGINIALLYETAEFLRGKGLYEEATELQLLFDPDGAVEALDTAIQRHHEQGDHKKAVFLSQVLVNIPRNRYAFDSAFMAELEWEQGIECAEEIGDFQSAYKFAVDCYGEDNSLAQTYKSIMKLNEKKAK